MLEVFCCEEDERATCDVPNNKFVADVVEVARTADDSSKTVATSPDVDVTLSKIDKERLS